MIFGRYEASTVIKQQVPRCQCYFNESVTR